MRHVAKCILAASAAAALLIPAAPALAASTGAAATLTAVGSAIALPSSAVSLGGVPGDQTLSFDVVLRPRDQVALDAFVRDVSTPGSPQYHHFLKTGEFADRFGPTPATITAVSSRLTALGLHVGDPTGSVLPVSATAAAVSAALHTSLSTVKLAGGRVARANTTAPKLPVDVARFVQAVVGLDTVIQAQHATVAPAAVTPHATGPQQSCLLPGSPATHYYNADQLAAYYGLDDYYTGNELGTGIHVALFELEPYAANDISAYKGCYGVTTTVNPIVVAGPSSGDGQEATLDIEDVIGLAPAATVDVYEGVNNGSGIFDVYMY